MKKGIENTEVLIIILFTYKIGKRETLIVLIGICIQAYLIEI